MRINGLIVTITPQLNGPAERTGEEVYAILDALCVHLGAGVGWFEMGAELDHIQEGRSSSLRREGNMGWNWTLMTGVILTISSANLCYFMLILMSEILSMSYHAQCTPGLCL